VERPHPPVVGRASKRYPSVLTSHVAVLCQTETRYLTDTGGTRVQHGRGFARVIITASARAADGTDLTTFRNIRSRGWGRAAPTIKALLRPSDRVANDVSALLRAPEAEPFVGPGDFFRTRGGRLLSRDLRAPRRRAPGKRTKAKGPDVSPRAWALKSCRTSSRWCSTPLAARRVAVDLNGWYDYDDEGVKRDR